MNSRLQIEPAFHKPMGVLMMTSSTSQIYSLQLSLRLKSQMQVLLKCGPQTLDMLQKLCIFVCSENVLFSRRHFFIQPIIFKLHAGRRCLLSNVNKEKLKITNANCPCCHYCCCHYTEMRRPMLYSAGSVYFHLVICVQHSTCRQNRLLTLKR